nr:hypothetical protein HK105_007266 [Polyrhizophydium stewartii]
MRLAPSPTMHFLSTAWAVNIDPKLLRQASFELLRRSFHRSPTSLQALVAARLAESAMPALSSLSASSFARDCRRASRKRASARAARPTAAPDAVISMFFYGPPSAEFETIRPEARELSLEHVREIQRIADAHYEHLQNVSRTLQRLLAAGVSDIRVAEDDNGTLELKVFVPGSLVGTNLTIEQWLVKIGIDPSSTHFTIESPASLRDAMPLTGDDLDSFLDMLTKLQESAQTMFTQQQSLGLTERRRTNNDLLDSYKSYLGSVPIPI